RPRDWKGTARARAARRADPLRLRGCGGGHLRPRDRARARGLHADRRDARHRRSDPRALRRDARLRAPRQWTATASRRADALAAPDTKATVSRRRYAAARAEALAERHHRNGRSLSSFFEALHERQAATRFVSSFAPPNRSGSMWSRQIDSARSPQ